MWISIKRRLLKWILLLWAYLTMRVDVVGLEKVKNVKGKAIVAANHLGVLDAILPFLLSPRDDFIFTVAEKYRRNPIYRFLVRQLDFLWLDRFEADIGTLREVLRRLEHGDVLIISPEGTRSQKESLLPGKPGVAYIAAKSGAIVIPMGVVGTEDRLVGRRFLRFQKQAVQVTVGEPFHVPPIPKMDRDVFLKTYTDEIMAHIAALLPEKYRGEYTHHPRVRQLLSLSGDSY